MQHSVRSNPLSDQVREVLLDRIKTGVYPPGFQLPPEHDLASEFRVSRSTVRRAIGALEMRGLIVRRHGVGTFISNLSRISHPLNEALDFEALITDNGYTFGVKFEKTSWIKADLKLATGMQVKEGDTLLQAYKIFTADDMPIIYCINELPEWVFPESIRDQVVADPTITEPYYDFLEQRCRQRIEYHVSKIRADIVRTCAFPNIPLPPDTPVLTMEEFGYNAKETPIWHSVEYYPDNPMQFELIRWRTDKR